MFDYVLQRIRASTLVQDPFPHLYLENLFTERDFARIVRSPEIDLADAATDDALIDRLLASGYKIIAFPGSLTDRKAYARWRRTRMTVAGTHSACEGAGMTLRLVEPRSEVLRALSDFLAGEAFNAEIARKFGLELAGTFIDCGIQKYLDGYEICPHPDNRNKALTYMVNINPHADSESREHHTHYLKFKPAYSYVREFWENNPDIERCWVPWHWCETVSVQRRNNSMVVFAPSNRTLHAVKASYDHLGGQRTQLYGNVWYQDAPERDIVQWERFDLKVDVRPADVTLRQFLASRLPLPLKDRLKRILRRGRRDVIDQRLVDSRRTRSY